MSAQAAPDWLPLPRPQLDGGELRDSHRVGLSAAEAAKEAKSRNGGGRVLSVNRVRGGYRVKLLKDGDMRLVFVADR
ncbi:MAG: hypothetical protein ACPGZP_00855 [Panacagrimonas sp.]